mgnify:FL=1
MKNLFIPLLACIACAVIVSFTAVSVRSTQELNLENDKKSKILLAAGINSENINEEFEKIEIIYVNFKSNELVEMDEKYDHLKATLKSDLSSVVPKEKDIAILKRMENVGPMYLWLDKEDNIEKVVLPIRGYGLWGTLYGHISLASDLNTINGIEFYEHKETPGLGAEVENEEWKNIWKGKILYNKDGGVELKVVKGASSNKYEVDGLSGATLTSNGVSNMIEYWLGPEAYGPALKIVKETFSS